MRKPDLRYTSARRLLRDFNDVNALRKNPLLAAYADESHDRLQARILRAVESLDPGLVVTRTSDRHNRLYQILCRCDLRGESRNEVAAALEISQSQFYVDRRNAFLLVADAIEQLPTRPQIDGPLSDAISLHFDYVEMLRKQGRFEASLRESLRVLSDVRDQPREIEIWTIVADAARFLADIQQSQEAVHQMTRFAATSAHHGLRRGLVLRIAIAEIALHGVQGRFNEALERFEQALKDSGDERTMHSSEATLFVILLGFGAELCIERGDWQRAKTLLDRTEGSIVRSAVPYARARLQRLRGRIAQELNGNAARSTLELGGSLRLLQHHKQLPEMAMGAVEYGVAVGCSDRREAMKFIDLGLAMAEDVCGYDQFAVLFAYAAPFFLERSGPDETLRKIAEIRMRAPLSERADFLVDLTEADVRLARGEFTVASESGINAAQSLEDAALFPAAARARLIAVEAYMRDGKPTKARHLFRKSRELLRTYADYATRQRALRSGISLHF